MSKFKFGEKARKFKAMIPVILDAMANEALNHFKGDVFNEAAFDGNKWAPKKNPDGGRLMVNSGRLRGGFYIAARRAGSRTIRNNVSYFEYHQAGTQHLPQRKMMGSTRRLRAKQKAMLKASIRKIMRG